MSDDPIYGYFTQQFHSAVRHDAHRAAVALYNIAQLFAAEQAGEAVHFIDQVKEIAGVSLKGHEEASKIFEAMVRPPVSSFAP